MAAVKNGRIMLGCHGRSAFVAVFTAAASGFRAFDQTAEISHVVVRSDTDSLRCRNAGRHSCHFTKCRFDGVECICINQVN